MSVSTVSATGIQDPTGQVFANGTWQLYFTPTYATPGPFTDGGVVFTRIYGGILDATGSFSQVGVNRNDTISPAGSRWKLIVTPAAPSASTEVLINVNAPAVDVTAAINALIQPIQVGAHGLPRAYKDAELNNPDGSGAMYYDETLKVLKLWDAVSGTWVTTLLSGGSPTFNVVNATGGYQFNGAAALNTFLKGNGTSYVSGSPILASADFANQGTSITVLHGNAAGNPSFGAVNLATDTTGSLPLSGVGAPTGTGFSHITAGAWDAASKLINLTSATDVAPNQGSTVTVLHGNAAGQALFTSITPSDAGANVTGSGNFVLATGAVIASPSISSPALSSTGLTIAGATSGVIGVVATPIANNTTLTLPNGADTLVGKATTDIFTNKTLDTAGAGNVLKINGTQVSAVTGTGSVVLATSPVLTTPNIGAATGTSLSTTGNISALTAGVGTTIHGGAADVTFNAVTGGTVDLVVANTAGVFTLNLPLATDTLVGKNTADTFNNKTIDTASPNTIKINGNALSATAGVATVTVPNSTDTLVGRATTDSLTNKTLVTPVIQNVGTTTTVLHGNAAGNASFSAVSLATDVTGSLPVGSVTAPTGTGFAHITTGAFDAASKLVNLTATTDVAANQGTTTTLLHGNAAGQPSWTGVNLTADATANQGTVNQVLHGNAAGQPSFSSVSLTADVTGTLPVANGGTGVTTSTGTTNVVLSNSPTLVTPTLGVASGTSLTLNANNSTTLPSAIAGYLNYDTTGHHLQIASQVTGVNNSDILFYTGSNAPAVLQWSINPTGSLQSSAGVPLILGGATSGITTVQASAVAGATTLTLPAATDTLIARATTDTVTNKRVTPRQVSMADATSVTPTSDTADINTFVSTQIAGTLTVNAPTGTPTDGQKLVLRLKSTNAQTYSFNATYHFGSTVTAPTTLAAGKTDYIGCMWNGTNTAWEVVAVAQGY